MEIGGGVGLVNYFGDFNENLFGNMQPMGSIVAKYRPNPRMSWAVTIGYGNLKGSVRDEKTWYPETETMPADFSHSLIDGGLRFEYNFWPYGTGREYRGAKHLAPFITLGLGTTYAKTPDEGVLALNIPFGAGVKYKIRDRLNLTAELKGHAHQSKCGWKYGETPTAAWAIVNISGARQFTVLNTQVCVRAGIENLFDRNYATYADWCHIPQKGRNIYMNLTLEL